MTELIETPKSLLHSCYMKLLEGVQKDPTPAIKKKFIASVEDFIVQPTTDKINLEEPVNFQFNDREGSRLIPLWLFILFNTERVFKNLSSIEDREKKLGKIIDLLLPVVTLSGTSEFYRSLTAEATRYKFWYTAYRLAPLDPHCGSDRDMIFQYCSCILNREKKLTKVVLQILDRIEDTESKINNQTTGSGRTALHYACAYSNPEIVKWLVAKGIDLNAQDVYGHTALWHCISGVEAGIQHGEPRSAASEIMSFMLESGANPFIANHKGTFFLDHLKKNFRSDKNIIKTIRSMPKPNKSITKRLVIDNNSNLLAEISDLDVEYHDTDILYKSPKDITDNLIVLFKKLAITEFYPKDIMDILSRRKRCHNKKFAKGSPDWFSGSFDLSDFVREVINMSSKKGSPISFEKTSWNITINK